MIVKLVQRPPQQSGKQKTVFTFVAAIRFPGRRVYKDVSFKRQIAIRTTAPLHPV